MSVELKTTRVFKIRKQTFRKTFNTSTENIWIEKIKAYDQQGEEDHPWEITCSTSECDFHNVLYLSGRNQCENIKYERCFCKLNVYNNKEKLTIYKGFLSRPNFQSFNFCDLSYYTDCQDPNIDISFTIASCDENKRKPTEPQKAMLDQAILTDMVIKTKEQEFPCHKVIIAAESEYFRAMFQSDMKEQRTSVVEWTDVFEASVIKDLLHFIYTGQKPPDIKENKFKLLEAAHLCQLNKLRDMCANRIGEDIDVENAGRVLETSEIYELEDLKTIAFKFMVVNHEKVFETVAYKEIDVNIKSRLLNNVFEVLK